MGYFCCWIKKKNTTEAAIWAIIKARHPLENWIDQSNQSSSSLSRERGIPRLPIAVYSWNVHGTYPCFSCHCGFHHHLSRVGDMCSVCFLLHLPFGCPHFCDLCTLFLHLIVFMLHIQSWLSHAVFPTLNPLFWNLLVIPQVVYMVRSQERYLKGNRENAQTLT